MGRILSEQNYEDIFCNEKKEPSELAEILQMHLAHFVFRGFNCGGYC